MENDLKTVLEQCRNVAAGAGIDINSSLGAIQETLEKMLESLETLPKRMCDEMEATEEIRKQSELESLQKAIEFQNDHAKHLNKIKFGMDQTCK